MSNKIANVQSKMSRQVTIETPFPSLAETARILGVSPAEAERVQKMITEHMVKARAEPSLGRAQIFERRQRNTSL
jgi:hypothetical protein